MNKTSDRDIPAPSDQSGGDVAAVLKKIQLQLVYLEKKIDGLVNQLQERQYRENSSVDRPFAKKSHSKTKPVSGRSRSRENKKHGAKPEGKGSDQPFYSRFRKADGRPGSGSRKKSHHRGEKSGGR